MLCHETLEQFEISRGNFLGLAKHDIALADCNFGKNFSRSRVGNGEVGARGPILLAAPGIVLDDPSRTHAGK